MVDAEREANRLLGQIQPHPETRSFFTPGNPADEWLPNQIRITDATSLAAWAGANAAFNRVYIAYFGTREQDQRDLTPHDLVGVIDSFRQGQVDHGFSSAFHTRHVFGESEAYVIAAEEAEEYGPYMEELRRLTQLLGHAISLDPLPDPGPSIPSYPGK